VKPDISDNFSHAWELMCVCTEAYLCLLAMELQKMEDISSRPNSAPDGIENASDEEKSKYFENVCSSLVSHVWYRLDTDLLQHDDGTSLEMFCCGEDKDEAVIGCEARSRCTKGEYFHYSCVNVDPDNIKGDWFCSDECRQQQIPYSYCTCKTDLGSDEPMIGCSAEHLCTKVEWYHMKCLGIDPDKTIKGDWFCSSECKKRLKGKGRKQKGQDTSITYENDRKRDYSVALLWRGLNLLCRRDAVREADGDAMMAYWKLDLVYFFAKKHPKYVILAHRLISSINGWAPANVRHDLIYNRTVNYGGGIGRNLPNDFMNEILNRLFKDLLSSAKGRYTDITIDRCSQIIGPFGEALDSVFDVNIVENEIYRHRRRTVNRDSNVQNLVEFLQTEKLFEVRSGRFHQGFKDFQYSENPKQAGKFAGKMKQLCKRLDRRRHVVIDA
jgi:hypothetical protein